MRRPEEFTTAYRGVRARTGRVALFLGSAYALDTAGLSEAKVGFVVSKKVGNSVIRHRITRQLRHIMRPLVIDGHIAHGEYLLIQALPGSAGSSSQEFHSDITKALEKCRYKQQKRGEE